MSNKIKINIDYRDYPEYMFAMIAAYLPKDEGNDLRRVAGSVIFRHEDKYGNTYKNGLLHSYNDLPALIDIFSTSHWYMNGKLHREGDLPAVKYSNGTNKWYKNGKKHRDGDKPAYIDKYKHYQAWYKNGKRHRECDLPAIICIYNDNPALICRIKEEWYKDGVLRRQYERPF